MNNAACITIGIFLFPLYFSHAESHQSSTVVSEKCSNRYPQKAMAFERENRIELKKAIELELKHTKGEMTQKEVDSFCFTMFGTKYGKIKFTSEPNEALIKVGGQPQDEKTNITLNFRVGTYSYSIEPPQKSACTGTVKVTQNKTARVNCQKD